MKLVVRTTLALATAGVVLGALTPTAYADPVGPLPGIVQVGTSACVPSSVNTTIYDPPTVHTYTGTSDTLYHWTVTAETTTPGCQNNVITMNVQLSDQAYDGSSTPTRGASYKATARGDDVDIADVWVDYSDAEMATLTFHTLTAVVTGTQTDSRTAPTPFCATRSWTYIPTPAGPTDMQPTPTETCAGTAH